MKNPQQGSRENCLVIARNAAAHCVDTKDGEMPNPRIFCDLYLMFKGCLHDIDSISARYEALIWAAQACDMGYTPALNMVSGDLFYWDSCKKDGLGCTVLNSGSTSHAQKASAAGYLCSIARDAAMVEEVEEARRRAFARLRAAERAKQAYRDYLDAMEEAMEAAEEAQRQYEEHIAEEKRIAKALDDRERFSNMLFGSGNWTNEELYRQGKKSSDEMWLDQQIREKREKRERGE